MAFPHDSALMLHPGAMPALCATAAADFGAFIANAFFWLTLVLAVAGSVLSAFCLAAPVSEPKGDPYLFIGQWFIWLATPLLWGTVIGSLAFPWARLFDLLAMLVVLAAAGWGAQAISNFRWRGSSARQIPTMPYLPREQRHS